MMVQTRNNRGKKTTAILAYIHRTAGHAERRIVMLFATQVILGIGNVSLALMLRSLINAVAAGDKKLFFAWAFGFSAFILFLLLVRAGERHLEESTRSEIENRLKKRLFDTLLARDYASVTKIHSGEWLNRLTSDTTIVADGMIQIVPGVSGMLVNMAGALAAIVWLESGFLYLLIPGGVLLMIVTYAFRRILKQLHRNIQEADGRLKVFLTERLGSLMILHAFGKETEASAKADGLMQEHRAARMKRNHFSNICNMGFGLAMNGVYVIGVVVCGYGMLNGTMSYGTLVAMMQLIGQLQTPFANITAYVPKYYAMMTSAERLMEAEDYPADRNELRPEEDLKSFYRGEFAELEFRNVTFAYPDDSEMFVLKHRNLSIKKGEYLAFTGHSGCGKSTVMKLLFCLYPLQEGEILLHTGASRNGYEAPRRLDSSYRGLFAYVPQGNQLFSGTIREMLAFGDQSRMNCEQEMERALYIACADGFVHALERGLDTELGERGQGLSEGQLQRLAIARAIFADRPVLLLDEATSALDQETEKTVLKRLRELTDKTVIIITHRPAALAICDRSAEFGEEDMHG